MKTRTGVIEDLHYQDDGCTMHIDCGDGVHTATLAKDVVEKHGYRKGMQVKVEIDGEGKAVSVVVRTAEAN